MSQLEHQERLADVHPMLQAFALRVPLVLGGRWQVGRGATTDATQAALYAKGRTEVGAIVTYASKASETAHGVRLAGACAVDFVALEEDGKADWGPQRYRKLGALAVSNGFEWGGAFQHYNPVTCRMEPLPDLGHVQLAGWRKLPLKETPK